MQETAKVQFMHLYVTFLHFTFLRFLYLVTSYNAGRLFALAASGYFLLCMRGSWLFKSQARPCLFPNDNLFGRTSSIDEQQYRHGLHYFETSSIALDTLLCLPSRKRFGKPRCLPWEACQANARSDGTDSIQSTERNFISIPQQRHAR